MDQSLLSDLITILGTDNVISDVDELTYYSQDVFWEGETAVAVIRPKTKQALAKAMIVIANAGCVITTRGGGMSYTQGYIPANDKTVVIDTSALDKIVTINEQDMYVTVEAGCTWAHLYEELKKRGLRTPYYGPMSGLVATVGGTLSQNSLFYGSGTYGTAAESVLALEVITADGKSIRTGSSANKAGEPFYRFYGPDLTGLFLADAGALGIKVEATLRCIPFPEATEYASFAFENFYDMVDAQSAIAREQLAAECFGLDPYLNGARSEVKDVKTGLSALASVAKSEASLAKGVKSAFAIAKAGTGFLTETPYTLHITADAPYADGAKWKINRIHDICSSKGRVIEDSIPRVMRAEPFQAVGQYLTGSEGELWVPIHAGAPASKIKTIFDATMTYFESKRSILDEFNISTSHLSTNCGYDLSFEPAFYYPDKKNLFHYRNVDAKDAALFRTQAKVPGATEAVKVMLHDLAQLFMKHGAVNRQLGKFYPYREAMSPDTYSMIKSIKLALDPNCIINPGALGLRN